MSEEEQNIYHIARGYALNYANVYPAKDTETLVAEKTDYALGVIKQHREAYAIEARVDELEKIEIGGDNIWTVDDGTDTAMLIEERIAELREKVGT